MSIRICRIVVFAAQATEKLVQVRVFGNSFFVKVFPLSFQKVVSMWTNVWKIWIHVAHTQVGNHKTSNNSVFNR